MPTFVLDDAVGDFETLSEGRFGPDLMTVYDDWSAFTDFPCIVCTTTAPRPSAPPQPAPAPRLAFAIGINCRSHPDESGATVPDVPVTFTKYPT